MLGIEIFGYNRPLETRLIGERLNFASEAVL